MPTTQPLPPDAQSALDEYLTNLDEALPGLYQGVYLTGSLALGDWQPWRSDLDILVVTSRRLTDADMDALAAVHAKTPYEPYRDATYIPQDALGRRPDRQGSGFPHAYDGVFERDNYHPDPFLWATLHRHGVTVQGTPAAELGVAPDAVWLREWNLANLMEDYWKPWAWQMRGLDGVWPADTPALPAFVVWGLLGPGRLHCTIATGEIISKTESADYTARLLPEYAELLARAKAWRLGDDTVTFTRGEGVAACDLVDAVIAAAAKL
ncbi:nucleotidyltransferase domain-containing protein [Actinocrinis sp.]|uniref:nucleotidyltransferase domain-containing protein n=1 Tax=Actinocrinis sp. TaxID=1920516 RepID=UPI002D3E7C8B|nr:nucleotidyltransferase domain-containing protein [Actinocrinis sp.]HZP54918.1 nucleotidyltransferase domain-containing protein [Actinocrinis sp.]